MPRATQSRRRNRPRPPRRRIRIEAPLPPAPRGWWGLAMRLLLAAKSLPVVLLLFAALTGWLGLHVRRDVAAERNWPSVLGAVQSIDAIQVACGGYSTHGGSIPRTCTRYRTTYRYQIDGVTHTGTVPGIYDGPSTPRVYYDPRDPSQSVLTPGGDHSGTFMIAVAISLALLAPIAWGRALRRRWQTTFAPGESEESDRPDPSPGASGVADAPDPDAAGPHDEAPELDPGGAEPEGVERHEPARYPTGT